jgi:nucleotide-diphospho-sugar transferase
MKPTVCLVTAYDQAYAACAALTVPRMRAFSTLHGYELRALRREACARPGGWIKIEPILEALEDDFDFVFWMDADALIIRRDVDVRTAAIDGADLMMVWHGPDTAELLEPNFIPHFNSGVMLIRSSDWSREFFARVWETGQLPHTWRDQAAMLRLLGYDNILGLGPERPDEPNRSQIARLATVWNAIPGVAMVPDPIVHHFAGRPLDDRLRLLHETAKSLWSRDISSTLRRAFSRLRMRQ